MINPFTKTEEKAIIRYVFLIVDADCNINQNEKAFVTLLGLKFGFTQLDLFNAVSMDESDAVRALSTMTMDKKKLAAVLLVAAAMSNGSSKLYRPEMDKCSDILHKCCLPKDIKFTDSLIIAHQFVDR